MVKMAIVLSAITLFYGIVLTVAFNFEILKRDFEDWVSKIHSKLKSLLQNLDQLITRFSDRRGNDSRGQFAD